MHLQHAKYAALLYRVECDWGQRAGRAESTRRRGHFVCLHSAPCGFVWQKNPHSRPSPVCSKGWL